MQTESYRLRRPPWSSSFYTSFPLAIALTCLLLIPASIGAPTAEDEESEGGCYYMFAHYEEGDRIMTNEPCLNCTCHNSMLMCYLRVCPFTKPIGQDCRVEKKPDQCCPTITCPQVPVSLVTPGSLLSTTTASPESTAVALPSQRGCQIGNDFYADGAQVASDPEKPCELCYCIRNRTACVMQECILHVEGCEPVFEHGVCCPVRYKCDFPLGIETTTISGLISTTIATIFKTPPPTAHTGGCMREGEFYHDGSQIATPGEAPCEHCYCMRGEIVCAVQDCGSPLENEGGGDCKAIPPRTGLCCPEKYTCQPSRQDRMFKMAMSANETQAVTELTTAQPIRIQSPAAVVSTEKEEETTAFPGPLDTVSRVPPLTEKVEETSKEPETTESLETEGTTTRVVIQGLGTSSERPEPVHDDTSAETEAPATQSPHPVSAEPKESEELTSTQGSSAAEIKESSPESQVPTTTEGAAEVKESSPEAQVPTTTEGISEVKESSPEAQVPTTTEGAAEVKESSPEAQVPTTTEGAAEVKESSPEAQVPTTTEGAAEVKESSPEAQVPTTTEGAAEVKESSPEAQVPTTTESSAEVKEGSTETAPPEEIGKPTTQPEEVRQPSTSAPIPEDTSLPEGTETPSTSGSESSLPEEIVDKTTTPESVAAVTSEIPKVPSQETTAETAVTSEATDRPLADETQEHHTSTESAVISSEPSGHTVAPSKEDLSSTTAVVEVEGGTTQAMDAESQLSHGTEGSVSEKVSAETTTLEPKLEEKVHVAPQNIMAPLRPTTVGPVNETEQSTETLPIAMPSSSHSPGASEVEPVEVSTQSSEPEHSTNVPKQAEEASSSVHPETASVKPAAPISESGSTEAPLEVPTTTRAEEMSEAPGSGVSSSEESESKHVTTEHSLPIVTESPEPATETVSPELVHSSASPIASTEHPGASDLTEPSVSQTSEIRESTEAAAGISSEKPESLEPAGVTSEKPESMEPVEITPKTPESREPVGITSEKPESMEPAEISSEKPEPIEPANVTTPGSESSEAVTSSRPETAETVAVSSEEPSATEAVTSRPELTETSSEAASAPSSESESSTESLPASQEPPHSDDSGHTEEPSQPPLESSSESEDLKVASTTVRVDIGGPSEGSVTSPAEDLEVSSVTPEEVEESTPTTVTRIPGEGSCFVEGITYRNGSRIPPSTPCQLACACQNSIVHCLLVHCPAAPLNSNGVDKCRAIYKQETCCPTYNCTEEETSPRPVILVTPESIHSQKPADLVTITPQAQTTTERLPTPSSDEAESEEKPSSESAEEKPTTLTAEASSTTHEGIVSVQTSSVFPPPDQVHESSTAQPIENKESESEVTEMPGHHADVTGQNQVTSEPSSVGETTTEAQQSPISTHTETPGQISTHPETQSPISTQSEAPGQIPTHPTTESPVSTHPETDSSTSTHTEAPGQISTHPETESPVSTHPETESPISSHPETESPISTHTETPGPISTHPETSSSSVPEVESTTAETIDRIGNKTASAAPIPSYDETEHEMSNETVAPSPHEAVTSSPVIPAVSEPEVPLGNDTIAHAPSSETSTIEPESETISSAHGNETEPHGSEPGTVSSPPESETVAPSAEPEQITTSPQHELSTSAPVLRNETESTVPPAHLVSSEAPPTSEEQVPEATTLHSVQAQNASTETDLNETTLRPEPISELQNGSVTAAPENPLYPVTTTTTVTPAPAQWPYPSSSTSTTVSPPVSNGACLFDARVYMSAQQIPRDDPCDFCFCFRGDIICLQQSCPPPIPGCYEEPIPGFCCPRYECPVGSNSTSPSDAPPSYYHNTNFLSNQTNSGGQGGAGGSNIGGGGQGCEIQGEYYEAGQLITATSGPCLECRCGSGGIMECDPRECQPEPMLRKMIEAIASRR